MERQQDQPLPTIQFVDFVLLDSLLGFPQAPCFCRSSWSPLVEILPQPAKLERNLSRFGFCLGPGEFLSDARLFSDSRNLGHHAGNGGSCHKQTDRHPFFHGGSCL